MALVGKVREHFLRQAEYCAGPGLSPFTARVARALAEMLDPSSEFGRRISGWGDTADADVLCLRACAALHAAARRSPFAGLGTAYPPNEASDEILHAAIGSAIRADDAFLATYLDRPPQTNEPARSSMILGGSLHLAKRFGLPLEMWEIGTSAGLNLRFADYGYDLGGGRHWGRTDPPLTIASEWRGNLPPLDAPLSVVGVRGCDLTPLDLSSPADAERLVSYVWPDQADRLSRIEAAIRHARSMPSQVESADAGTWIEEQLRRPASAGVARVLFHTIVWQYLPDATKARVRAATEEAGAEAGENRPFAWLRFENDGKEPHGRIDLTTWPGGETRLLGRADFHGRWVEWA